MARWSGDGSWQNILYGVYAKIIGSFSLNNNYDPSSGIKVIPLDFLKSGYYYFVSGLIYERNTYGGYWQSGIAYTTHADSLTFFSSRLTPQSNHDEGFGFSVRWGDKFML